MMDLPIDRKYALIGDDYDDYILALQYQRAYKTLLISSNSIDTIAMPILYLLRHYLELLLKTNIQYFSKYSKSDNLIEKLNQTHELEKLKNSFFEHYKSATKNHSLSITFQEINIAKQALSELIDKLDSIDKHSHSFRYVYNNEKNKQFEDQDRQFEDAIYINFHELINCLEEGEKILLYSIDIFEEGVLK